MSEEDAIEVLENIKNSKHIRTELQPFGYAMAIKETTNYTIGTRELSAIETALNLIQKQQHRLKVANEYIESRKDNMIPEHYDDLKYIINECDLDSTW